MITKQAPSRIIGFDLARAFAIFGMVLVNYEIAMSAGENGPASLIFLVGLVQGKAAATFVILAGVGLSLMSAKARELKDPVLLKNKQSLLFKRALFLLVVGLIYTPLWPADILHFYGIYIFVGACLLNASNKMLLSAAIAFVLGFLVLFMLLDYESGWNWQTLVYEDFWTLNGLVRHLFFNGFHPVFPWTSFLLFGMWLGRKDLTNPRTRLFMLCAGILALFLAELLAKVTGSVFGSLGLDDEAISFLSSTSPMPPMPAYLCAGSGAALILISLSISFSLKFPKHKLTLALVHTGQLALTLYVAHVVIGMIFLDIIGRLENQTLVFSVSSSICFCLLSILFSSKWRKHHQQGPIEWFMRRMVKLLSFGSSANHK